MISSDSWLHTNGSQRIVVNWVLTVIFSFLESRSQNVTGFRKIWVNAGPLLMEYTSRYFVIRER